MNNNKLKNGPVAAAFVFDGTDDRWLAMAGTPSPEASLSLILPECMCHSVLPDRVHDMRIIVYEFPSEASIPKPSRETAIRYYHDMLMPTVEKLGLNPSIDIHTQEIVFSLLNNIPIELNKPGNGIRQRSEYAEHCRSFRGGLSDVNGKGTTVVLPSGEKVGFGLKAGVCQGSGAVSSLKHKTPDKEVKFPKHRIN